MRWVARILLGLLLLVLGSASFLLLFPDVWVTPALLARAAGWLESSGHRIAWRDLEIDVEREGLFVWHVSLDAQGPSYGGPGVGVSAASLQTRARIKWLQIGWPGAFAFARLDAGDLRLEIKESENEKKAPAAEAEVGPVGPWPFLPEIGSARVEVSEARWGAAQGEAASGRIEVATTEAGQTWRFSGEWAKGASERVRVKGEATTRPTGSPVPWPFTVSLEAGGKAAGWEGTASVDGRVESESEGKLTVLARAAGREGRGRATITAQGGTYQGRLSVDATWDARTRKLPPARLKGGSIAWQRSGAAWDVKGELPASLRMPAGLARAVRRNRWFDVTLGVEARLSPRGLVGPASARVVLGPVSDPSATLEARLPAGVGRALATPEGAELPITFRLGIERFERVVVGLAGTPFAVPQPLAQLGGKIAVEASGETNPAKKTGHVPVSLSFDLTGDRQRLALRWRGNVSGDLDASPPRLHVEGDAELEEVTLALPELQLEQMPPLTPDRRFVPSKKPAPREPGLLFTYDVRVRTRSPGALRLISSLGPDLVPLSLDLRARPEPGVEGSLSTGGFNVRLFRKQVEVRQLRLARNVSTGSWEVDGRFFMRHADYQIEAVVVGPVEHPQLRLFSIPPLRQDQILALLVFGRPLEELGTEESVSVGSAEAALADGALNLVSIFALASTPIESVNYDPRTGRALAKVRLADGTTLAVGSEGRDIERLGIRQRIAAEWYIQTYLESLNNWERRSVSALLEWIKRY